MEGGAKSTRDMILGQERSRQVQPWPIVRVQTDRLQPTTAVLNLCRRIVDLFLGGMLVVYILSAHAFQVHDYPAYHGQGQTRGLTGLRCGWTTPSKARIS